MALRSCHACDAKFERGRFNCPHRGALAKGLLGLPAGYSKSWTKKLLIGVVVLGAINVWAVANRDFGPDPAAEALHSEEEAVLVCREAVESRLADRSPSIVGLGPSEYLQGGEYEVWLVVELQAGAVRAADQVLCQLQFTVETGWIVEDLTLERN